MTSANNVARNTLAPLPPESAPVLVNTPAQLQSMLQTLRRSPALALDTESNSFHAYYPRICLIQITTIAESPHSDLLLTPSYGNDENAQAEDTLRTAQPVIDYLVDPITLEEMSELGALLSSGIEVVMHAADNDMLLMQREYGWRMGRVFDTQLAARILGWEHAGLGAILEQEFGVVSDKRMQRTDWSRRPLQPDQIAYAQMDTHYLFVLQDLLTAELHATGRWDEAQAAFRQLERMDAANHPTSERTFWSMKAAHKTPLPELALLESLWEWRETEAQRQNRPPFKVMSDEGMQALAHARPKSMNELRSVRGITPEQVRRYGSAIQKAIIAGEERPQPPLPKPTPRPEFLLSTGERNRYEKLRTWRTDRAAARGVAPEIIFNNETLLAFVQQLPKTVDALAAMPSVGVWKANAYGEEVLAIIAP